ncbi:MAG: hypothetical protein KGM99_16130 [Burkholderiales bacterium]|nr:hypothetical protein [Burkholderiales bacterium]
MSQSAAAYKEGKMDAAMKLLRDAASTYPTEKSPWLQMAQIKFDASSYGEAIINAQEALQRDPVNQLANSIISVSGLRLSTKALADLSQQNNLSAPLKTEAQDLTKLLRESLGETVLVPPPPQKVHPAGKNVTGSRRASGRDNVATRKNGKHPAAEAESSNPFGSLK